MNQHKLPSVPRFEEKPRLAQYTSMNQVALHQPHLLEKRTTVNNELVPFYQMEQEYALEKPQKLSSPNLQLLGHQSEIYCCKFQPAGGNLLASAGFDRKIFLWDCTQDCQNIGIVGEAQNAVLQLEWSFDGTRLYAASADKTVASYDMETFQPLKKFKGHTSFVNSCSSTKRGGELLASGGDDGTIKLWDLRTKKFSLQFETKYPFTSVVFSDQGDKIYGGSLDNTIKCYDLRKQEVDYVLNAHTDTVTGIALSPDGSYILSNGMDMTLRAFDIRSFVVGRNRQVRIFTGATHNSSEKNLLRCAWSNDGQYVTCGSSDRSVYIWDFNSKKLVHRLSGHTGTVNEVVFNPTDFLLASASSDRTIIIGEIPEIRL